jgi:hypothetical protein
MVRLEEGVERTQPRDAQPGLQGAGGIVEAAVDHLGIARGDALADGAFLFQNGHNQTAPGERIAAGQPHRARAHHHRVEIELGHGHGPNVEARRWEPRPSTTRS